MMKKPNTFSKPPTLRGYNYPPWRAREARDSGKLLAIRLETSLRCNLRCIYCNGSSGTAAQGEITFGTMQRVISEARSLGAESVVVIGGGEPTVFPRFDPLVEFIDECGLIPVVMTNGQTCTRDLARFLLEHNASVLLKLDSLREDVQDTLGGKKGTWLRIREAIRNLVDVGFCRHASETLRVGGSFVVTRLNYHEIPDIWRFCRDNAFYPNLEALVPRNRALGAIDQLAVLPDDLLRLKETLLSIDHEYGYDWVVHTPLPGHGCLQVLYGAYITSKGYVRPCADIDIDERGLNVNEMSLAEVLNTDFFRRARQLDSHVGGSCADCEHGAVCVGCRGIAFTVARMEGLSIEESLCREDPMCRKTKKSECGLACGVLHAPMGI